ncbi:MAG: hypothetical protein RL693_2029 [Verrucomicrobiota bacterium]
MLQSLRIHHPDAHLTVLCLTDACANLVQQSGFPKLTILLLNDLEEAFPELLTCKNHRSTVEYYFTCTPYILLHTLARLEAPALVTYLDADLWFFSTPESVFREIGNASVAIVPHRFPPNLRDSEIYGIYNVGWISFRNSPEGIAALQWWAGQCHEWCHDRVEEGRFADQKYLDQIPQRFSDVHIIQHPGANLAPWNVDNHRIVIRENQIFVDNQTLVFFHFHGFVFHNTWLVSHPFKLYQTSPTRVLRKNIITPYLESLKRWERHVACSPSLERLGLPDSGDSTATISWRDLVTGVRAGHYILRGYRKIVVKLLMNFGVGREKKRGLKIKSKPVKLKPIKKVKTKPATETDLPSEIITEAPLPDCLRFNGDYTTWEEACNHALGYDAPLIFEKTRDSIRKVASGEAVFERDSVIFEIPEYPFSTIAGLLFAACARGGNLSVIDFGGSLGSVYFACRPWLDTLTELHWSVVEQPHYVACGQSEFANDTLAFHHNLEESIAWHRPDVILLSGVLHFLPDAVAFVAKLCQLNVPFLFIERTPFWESDRHRIVIQHVPAEIYAASYTCWLFCERLLLEQIEKVYERVVTYPAMDVIPLEGGKSYFKGMLFRRKPSAG